MTETDALPRQFYYQAGGDLVVSDQHDLDDAQATGRWIRVEGGLREVRA